MDRKEAALALQRAINQLILASSGIYCSDELPNDEDGITVSLGTEEEKAEIAIFNDGTIVFTPSRGRAPGDIFRDVFDRRSCHMIGRPKNLPPRTCPTCRGKGKI
jgi:hypothetical protein